MRHFISLAVLLLLTSCSIPESETTFTAAPITWEPVANAPLVRFEAQSAVVDGKLYAFGGYTQNIIPVSFEANAYDPIDDRWEKLPDIKVVDIVHIEDDLPPLKTPMAHLVWRMSLRQISPLSSRS